MYKGVFISALALITNQAIAACPSLVGKDAGGQYPHVFEKTEFETHYTCHMIFDENPAILSLNERIIGNPILPPLNDRLPQEPLLIAPYFSIGEYGGVFNGISKSAESGTSDLLSVRHVNLVRISDDLATIVPNVAKSWQWNDDFTQLTMKLRKGHKWSDGNAFTAHDIVFWYNNMLMDSNIIAKPNVGFLSQGKPIKVEALDDTTIRFTTHDAKPGLLSNFAFYHAQPFQPKHLLSDFHPKHNKNADKLAQSLGFDRGYDVINFYYGRSDWKDVPSPLIKNKSASKRLVDAGYTAVAPTLESHVLVEETPQGRILVANPYFFQVDTSGNQLPYINEIKEIFISDEYAQTSKLIAGEVDYKAQSISLPSALKLMKNRAKGQYKINLRPSIGAVSFAFNLTDKNLQKRALFNDVNFRRAMSLAINREQINETAYFSLGKPAQYTAIAAETASFIDEELLSKWTQFAPEKANSLLDLTGATDINGDGFRELPSGEKFTLTIHYSTQGTSTEVVKIVAENWTNVGVKTNIKQVTTNEYRSAQTANELSVLEWKIERPLASVASNSETLTPPYGKYHNLRTGMLWALYRDSNGLEGVKPPETVNEMQVLADKFNKLPYGSDDSNVLGKKIVEKVVDDLFIIGTVKTVAPIYYSKKLANFSVPKMSSPNDYYRVYPYIPSQWYLIGASSD